MVGINMLFTFQTFMSLQQENLKRGDTETPEEYSSRMDAEYSRRAVMAKELIEGRWTRGKPKIRSRLMKQTVKSLRAEYGEKRGFPIGIYGLPRSPKSAIVDMILEDIGKRYKRVKLQEGYFIWRRNRNY